MQWLRKIIRQRSASLETMLTVVNKEGLSSVVQLAGVHAVVDEGTWYYGDEKNRPTVLVKYMDDTWARHEIHINEFSEQVGDFLRKCQKPTKINYSQDQEKIAQTQK
tara:strand:- start:129 stop:449 length:321 start_codon:yes stop_codon:yes gene_type:complete